MVHFDPELYTRLLEDSNALTTPQRKWLLEKQNEMSATKKDRIFKALAKEQLERFKYNKERITINMDYLSKKTNLVNRYNEDIGQINEDSLIESLEGDLDSLYQE